MDHTLSHLAALVWVLISRSRSTGYSLAVTTEYAIDHVRLEALFYFTADVHAAGIVARPRATLPRFTIQRTRRTD